MTEDVAPVQDAKDQSSKILAPPDSQHTASLRIAEYESLRNEMLLNKQHIFERPLLIIGAAGVAASQLQGESLIYFLPAALIAFLWLNVQFTSDRIRSTARIVAYISVFHETNRFKWVGWENALREYRSWENKNKKKRQEIIESSRTKSDRPKALVFYPSVYWIHIIPAFFCLIATAGVLFIKNENIGRIAAVVTGALFISFVIATWKYNPNVMSSSIEEQREMWHAVFDDLPVSVASTVEEPAAQNRDIPFDRESVVCPETVPSE